MRVALQHTHDTTHVSKRHRYEYFPPRSREGMVNLEARFERMKQAAKPLFVEFSVQRQYETLSDE